MFGGELAGIRTQDPRLKRALLYLLSYELSLPLLKLSHQRVRSDERRL
jgi:hypothetical protein